MHKQFPIKPDYVGYSIATAPDDYVQVEENDGIISARALYSFQLILYFINSYK